MAHSFSCVLPPCEQGQRLIFTCAPVEEHPHILVPHALLLPQGALAPFAVGAALLAQHESEPLFQVEARRFYASARNMVDGAEAVVLRPVLGGQTTLGIARQGISLAVVTLSDKGATGQREDESGPLIASMVAEAMPLCRTAHFLLPDDPGTLRALVADLALRQGYDLVITTGGTGLSPRDTAPEALSPLLERSLPGLTQAMMAASLAKTPRAALSRAVAGTVGASIVLTLPGSKKAVRENLEAVMGALEHGLQKLQGDTRDCGIM